MSTTIIVIISIGVILIVLVAIFGGKAEKERKQKQIEALNSIPNFKPSRKTLNKHGFLAADTETKVLAIKNGEEDIKLFPFEKIKDCEIIEDGSVTFKKSGIGRAIVGGVLAGGVGAVVGGVTGKQTQRNEIKKLDFKILIKDINNPSINFTFFDAWIDSGQTKKTVKESETHSWEIYKQAHKEVTDWKDVIGLIIDEQSQN